ncbi:MAG: pilus assembly protein PilM [Woeseiaceae bacterium]|nr:pilus assembly protein PilM [Woeseiaceae bacterium]MDX2606774.1 pilus assembly protein PilM [Woeseiaceae bacterium]
MSALSQWIDRRRPTPKAVAFGSIGVYITQNHIHLVQLETLADGNIGVRARESLTYPGTRAELIAAPAAIRKLVRRAMRSGNFRGRSVVSAMPPEQVRVMSVSYPANAAKSEAGSIAQLMADRVDGALSDYVIDYVPIRMGSRDGNRLALVAISRLEHVNSYLDCLASAGLHIDFLEIGPLAIKRLVEFGPASSQRDNVLVINIGDTTSHLTTISGHRLLADQELQFGEKRVLDAIAKTLDLPTNVAKDLMLKNGLDSARNSNGEIDDDFDAETIAILVEIIKPEFLKLVREIQRAFLFAESESQGDGQRKIFIVGGMALWPGATALLSSLARMPVEILGCDHMPFAKNAASVETLTDRQAAEMSTAVGLALRGMSADE